MTCPDYVLCRAGDACAGHCKSAEIPGTAASLDLARHPSVFVYTPDDLYDFGYRIHMRPIGSLPDQDRLVVRYWWTWVDPIDGVTTHASDGDWATLDEAIAAARRELKENA